MIPQIVVCQELSFRDFVSNSSSLESECQPSDELTSTPIKCSTVIPLSSTISPIKESCEKIVSPSVTDLSSQSNHVDDINMDTYSVSKSFLHGSNISAELTDQFVSEQLKFPYQSGSKLNPIVADEVKENLIQYWSSDLGLTMDDYVMIEDGEWLTDSHVNAFSKLVLKAFPKQNGFQNPLILSQFQNFNYSSQEFVQILNVSNSHWICVSNIFCPQDIVEVYDSLPSLSKNSWCVFKQVAKILKTKANSFEIRYVDVQRQMGGSDCCLFSMAFALSLCLKQDPHAISYSQGKMRSHLVEIFEKKSVLPFPQPERPKRTKKGRILFQKKIDIHCICRMPWNKNESENGLLVCCNYCNLWYHQKCMNIPEKVIQCSASSFCCDGCK